MTDAAVIFDVDGVLLELTDDEAELFFVPFADYLDASKLSRDWNSYRIRNDSNIVDEILENNGLSPALKAPLVERYMNLLQHSLSAQQVVSTPISGAAHLLSELSALPVRLGIATANFREAARLRLAAAGLWDQVSHYAFGADGGGHKSEILARALSAIGTDKKRIVYVGDNVNDVIAGRENGVHFIAFSTSAERLITLKEAGAERTASTHAATLTHIREILAI
jgi:HAD superfamily hydrolase (TIGR01549 family)